MFYSNVRLSPVICRHAQNWDQKLWAFSNDNNFILDQTSLYNVIVHWIFYEHPFSILSISIYYGTQSDIRVKSYCRLNLLRASVLHFERLDILRDSIRHPSKKVIVVWICSELRYSISSVSIYYGTQSDIREKIYCRLNFLRASTFNFEHLDILRDSIGHPSKKLLSFEFAQSFGIPFRAFRCITGLNRTYE